MAGYGRFRFEWKNFLLGMGAFFVVLCLPFVSTPFISILDTIRDKLGSIGKKGDER